MKTVALGLCLVLSFMNAHGQSAKGAEHVIEGGRLVIELIKVLSSKIDAERNRGCKGLYADLCFFNETPSSIVVFLYHRSTNETREIIVQPLIRECGLQMTLGVWTYDLRKNNETVSIRKGDILIESCQNLTMNIK